VHRQHLPLPEVERQFAGDLSAGSGGLLQRKAGPRVRIRDRMSRYAASGVTTLTIAAEVASLDERLHVVRTMAELLGRVRAG
jgi:hypothetical protein